MNTGQKNMKTMVVDDDRDITSLYRAAFEGEEGLEINTYNDPREALSDL